MKQSLSKLPASVWWVAGIALFLVVATTTWTFWYPAANSAVDATIAVFRPNSKSTGDTHGVEAEHDHSAQADSDHDHGGHDHTGHDHASHDHASHDDEAHDHAGHNEASSLSLSTQAMRNIGLTPEYLKPLSLQTFRKSITVPAVIVERPGRTQVQVATPMTGVVTHVHAVQGEAVEPGSLLFQIRLTHEDLVQAQTEFLKTLGELDVEEREIARLRDVTTSGAVAGKLVLEREYARDRLTALLLAQREALRLHGLSEQQVEQIAQQRRLLRELQVFAPSIDSHDEDEIRLTVRRVQPVLYQPEDSNAVQAIDPSAAGAPLVLQQLNVHKGQSVNAGETLCTLADYQELFIEGLAFEQDVAQLRRASANDVSVDAVLQQSGNERQLIEGLTIAYLANQVDQDSRTLRFYVRLPNTITKDRTVEGNRYVQWEYLPGQRLQLRIPVESWPGQIVLPVDAVAREGAEFFVFEYQHGHFDRVPIHVKYRDQYSVVVADDGSLSPGDVVALRGAHQMQMALKNKAGGGVDPHAGHKH